METAKRSEGAGASALCVTVDYPYTGARDRPSRDQWDPEWARTRVYGTPEFRVGFQAGMIDPYTSNLTWEWMKWVRPATKLPIVIKGIMTAEDARLAVEHGATRSSSPITARERSMARRARSISCRRSSMPLAERFPCSSTAASAAAAT